MSSKSMKFIKELNDFRIFWDLDRKSYMAFHKYNGTFKSKFLLAELENDVVNVNSETFATV